MRAESARPPATPWPDAIRRAANPLACLLAAALINGGALQAAPQSGPLFPPPGHPSTAASAARLSAPGAPLRVCAGGDVLLGNNLDTLWAQRASARLGRAVRAFPDPDSLLGPLRPLVDDADVVLLNIEGAIGSGQAPVKCRPGSSSCYAFRQPVDAATALARFAAPAAVVGNVANNHALDAGAAGLLATIEHLSRAGVQVTGADTLPTLVVAPSGRDTVAILGFSTFRAGPDARDLEAVRRPVARAFARYRRVIVSVHMGAEGRDALRTSDRTEYFLGEDRGNPVAFARTALESGAGLVIGHGPHILRAAEWRGDGLTFYSLGNLLTYGPFNMRDPLDRGAVVCASLDPAGRVSDAVLRATRQYPPGVVGIDPSGRGTWLVDSLGRLDFPRTAARVSRYGAVTRPLEDGSR
ncbi:MAG: CapA family protein [Gemmatimonadota bacterium]|nr:MAG: CapA family protein [Gemmatimonadota bacterium]